MVCEDDENDRGSDGDGDLHYDWRQRYLSCWLVVARSWCVGVRHYPLLSASVRRSPQLAQLFRDALPNPTVLVVRKCPEFVRKYLHDSPTVRNVSPLSSYLRRWSSWCSIVHH